MFRRRLMKERQRTINRQSIELGCMLKKAPELPSKVSKQNTSTGGRSSRRSSARRGSCYALARFLPSQRSFPGHWLPFRHPLTPFLTPLPARGPHDREPLLLGKCSRIPRNLLPSPPSHLPFSFITFTSLKYRERKNGFLRLTY